MWANVQRDGRSAKYRWRPLFNAAKFGWRPLLECRAVTLQRRESRWNWKRCPKIANRSQPLVARSSPYYEDMWRRYQFNKFFSRLSIHVSSVKIQPDKVWRYLQRARYNAFSVWRKFIPSDLDLWPLPWYSNSSERGTKHVFHVNLPHICSVVPEIFHTQTNKT